MMVLYKNTGIFLDTKSSIKYAKLQYTSGRLSQDDVKFKGNINFREKFVVGIHCHRQCLKKKSLYIKSITVLTFFTINF